MRTGALRIGKVVEYFLLDRFLRAAAHLRLYMYFAEWLEVEVEHGAGVNGSRRH